jgi:GH15 family glucan-1,4-alpha-glucosidase
MMRRPTPYPPISAYALIGNRHTCALVSREGSLDWCCLPYLESASVFGAILDDARGGRWFLGCEGEGRRERRYLGHSAVLETIERVDDGTVRFVDFLPIREARGEEVSRSAATIVRIAECLSGTVEVVVEWTPRPDYARADVRLHRAGERQVLAVSEVGVCWIHGLPDERVELSGGSARSRVRLFAGERLELVSGWGDPTTASVDPGNQLAETLEWWERWARSCRIEPVAEPWREQILRSGVVLTLLTNERSGAIAAAPTTSLPEEIGGIRNWDYRYCWVRDASLISQAFVTLGRPGDGLAFLEFLERAAQRHRDPARIQVLYGLMGQVNVTEYTLGHLDGYRDSRPVRVGNAAAEQRQLDVYGELMEAANDLVRSGFQLPHEWWSWLSAIADHVCRVWRWKDRSIWEVRGPEQHFTYSKLMCWVALDRAIELARVLGASSDTTVWARERDAIRAALLDQGYDRERGSFVQAFGSHALDSSNLLIPLVGLLPADDPRVLGTIDATLRELTENGLVHRYSTEETEDGVSGAEGAFGICTFWLSDALCLAGRLEEAEEIFAGMLGRANDLGLYPEEIDPSTGDFLGNYPQAFTHVGLITGAHFLGEARSRGAAEPGPPHRSGSRSGNDGIDRARA